VTAEGFFEGWGVLEHAVELSRRGEAFVLATVVWREGPSSGHQGSRAIVTASGEIHGWIGGACAEPVLIREALRALDDRQARLLALGTAEQFGDLPQGTTAIPIACQSDGAMQIFIEPVVPAPHLVVVGCSPMAHTLCRLAGDLEWRADLIDGADFSSSDVASHTIVIVATQGHGDEDVLEQAVAGEAPAYIGVVASRPRGEALLGYLADRGTPQKVLDSIRAPAGLDLGRTSHKEVAVAILAELVALRAAGGLSSPTTVAQPAVTETVDPICGMTVTADATSHPFDFEGETYYFCCPGCRTTFAKGAASQVAKGPT
jgi:xanthine dehydrogenase accessory factor